MNMLRHFSPANGMTCCDWIDSGFLSLDGFGRWQ